MEIFETGKTSTSCLQKMMPQTFLCQKTQIFGKAQSKGFFKKFFVISFVVIAKKKLDLS